ncbi:MAG: xanthine dehydrogenase family protein molybdopterin-binding subunit, partial [Candidatus Bathyarchaeia archaeon]
MRELSVVGKRVPLKDAYEKASGSLKYAVDISSPEMLYGGILRSPHAHARITRIDTTKAESLPGVKAVVTHKDVPHEREWVGVWINSSRRVLDDTVRYVGDEVAAVAAVDRDTAEHALGLIDVDFEILPAVFDPEEAMKPSAPLIRKDGNVRKPSIIEWGDVENAFSKADIVVEHTSRIGSQEPAPLGRNAYIANWSRDGVTFTTSTQTPSHLRDIIANYFD